MFVDTGVAFRSVGVGTHFGRDVADDAVERDVRTAEVIGGEVDHTVHVGARV